MIRVCLLVVNSLLIVTSHLKAQSVEDAIRNYMTQAATLSGDDLQAILHANEADAEKSIGVAGSYLKESRDHVRQRGYYLIKRIGITSEYPSIRKRAVSMLIGALRDEDTGISGSALSALTKFRKDDFTTAAKDSIGNLVNSKARHLDELLKLCGYLELHQVEEVMKRFLSENISSKARLACHLALARMDDEESIEFLASKLKTSKVDEDWVQYVMPDIIYTRQRKLFRFLDEIIMGNDLACESGDPNVSRKRHCGYPVMECMASVVVDFPLRFDQNDLAEEDHRSALQSVKSWLLEHEDYVIRRDSY